jgi:hypothetical protein
VRRVNHSVEYKAEDGANVNQAESVVPRESEAVPLIREHVASGSIIHADESNAWERLHASYDVLFAVARAEIGQHHRISGHLLYQYANEAAWREDNRRKSNGTNWNTVIGAALASRKSQVWTGYWHRSAA